MKNCYENESRRKTRPSVVPMSIANNTTYGSGHLSIRGGKTRVPETVKDGTEGSKALTFPLLF